MFNPREAITSLTQELVAFVDTKDVPAAVSCFEKLVVAYRAAKMDWSHTLTQTTALIAPLGALAVERLMVRIADTDQVLRDATGPRYQTSPKLVASAWENARYDGAALRIALLRVLAVDGTNTEAFDQAFLPIPERLFEVAPNEGGKQHDFIARFLGALQLGGTVFQALPQPRARTFIAAWRSFNPGKNLELSLKALFKGRPELLKESKAPTMVERARSLAEQTGLACTARVYLLEPVAKHASANRIGGVPKGIHRDKVPRGLTPVLTVDLATLPELAARLPDVRALCLFVDSPHGGFDVATVVRLSTDEIEAGFSGGKPFAAVALDVPPEVFGATHSTGPLGALYTLLRQAPARALGEPFYLQQGANENNADEFVLEAKADFTGLNLGDTGKLFLFFNDACWESA